MRYLFHGCCMNIDGINRFDVPLENHSETNYRELYIFFFSTRRPNIKWCTVQRYREYLCCIIVVVAYRSLIDNGITYYAARIMCTTSDRSILWKRIDKTRVYIMVLLSGYPPTRLYSVRPTQCSSYTNYHPPNHRVMRAVFCTLFIISSIRR